ncbi:hypothetical protein [Natrialba sp. PRR66]|uniref:hypothetical protein n=1 Tax=Natrialba sp. PRR66 TaxID=3098146 RepID=UPI002B1D1EDB|nr:hypothetical protein [Natrialba sp. PRR66]
MCRWVESADEGEADDEDDGDSEADPVEEESDADDERVDEEGDADEAESVVGDASARAVVADVGSAIAGGAVSAVVGGGVDSFAAVEPDVVSFDTAGDSREDADSDIKTPLVQFLIAAGI